MEILAAVRGFFHADDHEVVALLGFRGDDVRSRGLMHDGGDLHWRVDFFLVLLLALGQFGRLLDGIAGLLGHLLLSFGDFLFLGGFLVVVFVLGFLHVVIFIRSFSVRLRGVLGLGFPFFLLFIFDLGCVLYVKNGRRHAVRARQHAGDA